MSRRKKNAGKGYGMMFHGAFATKADAVRKERSLSKRKNPGAFIQPRIIKGQKRFVVMSERNTPRKRNRRATNGNPLPEKTRALRIKYLKTLIANILKYKPEEREWMGLEPRLAEYRREVEELSSGKNPMDLVVMGANPEPHHSTQEFVVHPGQTITLKVNPEAESIREGFVGRPAQRSTTYTEPSSVIPSGDYAKLGQLVGFTFKPPNGGQVQGIVYYDGTRPLAEGAKSLLPLVDAPVLVSDESARQLYFVGGNQDISGKLHDFGAVHNPNSPLYELGELRTIVYRERKRFDDFELINYQHEFGEEDKKAGRKPSCPTLYFDPYSKRFLLKGGDYEVRPEGITN